MDHCCFVLFVGDSSFLLHRIDECTVTAGDDRYGITSPEYDPPLIHTDRPRPGQTLHPIPQDPSARRGLFLVTISLEVWLPTQDISHNHAYSLTPIIEPTGMGHHSSAPSRPACPAS